MRQGPATCESTRRWEPQFTWQSLGQARSRPSASIQGRFHAAEPAPHQPSPHPLRGGDDARCALRVLSLDGAQVCVQPILPPGTQHLSGHHLAEGAGAHCVGLFRGRGRGGGWPTVGGPGCWSAWWRWCTAEAWPTAVLLARAAPRSTAQHAATPHHGTAQRTWMVMVSFSMMGGCAVTQPRRKPAGA